MGVAFKIKFLLILRVESGLKTQSFCRESKKIRGRGVAGIWVC